MDRPCKSPDAGLASIRAESEEFLRTTAGAGGPQRDSKVV